MKSLRLGEPLDALDFVRESSRHVIQTGCGLRVARIEEEEADMHDKGLSPAQITANRFEFAKGQFHVITFEIKLRPRWKPGPGSAAVIS